MRAHTHGHTHMHALPPPPPPTHTHTLYFSITWDNSDNIAVFIASFENQ